jgi:hypothetical protein
MACKLSVPSRAIYRSSHSQFEGSRKDTVLSKGQHIRSIECVLAHSTAGILHKTF